jgi:UDP-glucuronate decarboxylase
MKKILVTGGAVFLGSHLCDRLAEKIIQLTGTSSKIVFQDLPQDDPKQRRPDIAKANAILNWKPTINLEQGLIKTIKYFRSVL